MIYDVLNFDHRRLFLQLVITSKWKIEISDCSSMDRSYISNPHHWRLRDHHDRVGGEKQNIWRIRTVNHFLLHMMWLIHISNHNSCDYLHENFSRHSELKFHHRWGKGPWVPATPWEDAGWWWMLREGESLLFGDVFAAMFPVGDTIISKFIIEIYIYAHIYIIFKWQIKILHIKHFI